MPVIQWEERLSVGLPQIDEHHRHLFMLLNKAYNAFGGPNASEELTQLLDELIDYAIYHFFFEEQAMAENNYPRLDQHRQAHDFFTSRVVALHEEHHTGKRPLTLDVLAFLQSWLINHIVETDGQFGRFITETKKPLPIRARVGQAKA